MIQASKITLGLFLLILISGACQQYVITSEPKYIIRSNPTVEAMSFCGGKQLKDSMAVTDAKLDLIICTRGQKNIVDHYFLQSSILHRSCYNLVNDSLSLISHTQINVDSLGVKYETGSGFYEVMWEGSASDRYTKDVSLYVGDRMISRAYYGSVSFNNKDIPHFTETKVLNDLIESCEKSFESVARPK